MTTQQSFETALAHFQAGRFSEAEKLCRQILAQHPTQLDAMHLLGVLAFKAGELEAAVALLGRVVANSPPRAEPYCNLGVALKAQGKLAQAILCYRSALAASPDYSQAHNNLGNALLELGKVDDAIASFRRAIELQPDSPEYQGRLGNALFQKGETDQAIALYRVVLAAHPMMAEYHNNLGNGLRKKGMIQEAAASYQQAISLQSNSPDAYGNLGTLLHEHGQIKNAIPLLQQAVSLLPSSPAMLYNLGNALRDDGQLNESIECYQRCLGLRSTMVDVLNNLGNVLKVVGRVDEAIACYERILGIDPNHILARNNLGSALQQVGKFDEAERCYTDALKLNPDYAPFHWNLGLVLLTQGKFIEGWPHYAWRRRVDQFQFSRAPHSQPVWDGSTLAGKRILIHAEQGLGDTIQFARYLPMVAQRGGKIILECQKPLFTLLQSVPGIEQMISVEDPSPQCDVQAPLIDLPMIFQTTLETVPATIPYLSPPTEAVAQWKQRIGSDHHLKVGLIWMGRSAHYNDRNRSLPLSALFPLASVSGVSFHCLQKDRDGFADFGPLQMKDWAAELTDFKQTAALLENLDLLITVDTAAAHLAGAMGKPAWLLLPFSPDWRWMLGREDSPWYPSMRLFRQPRTGDWQTPIARVVDSLTEWAGRKEIH
jgi:tetratricopeptide (TPR) repeat protein